MNILSRIIEDKRIEVENDLNWITKEKLRKNRCDGRVPLDFRGALASSGLSIIAEVKKASPSKGLIREDFHPVSIARSYEEAGADCLSVLTERNYFQGSTQFLKDIKSKINIPVLRKDFIIDKRQIRESYDLGADAILLIVSALKKVELEELKLMAEDFGLAVLVEVHSKEELDMALELNCNLIGINNRNLLSFETRIEQSIELKPFLNDSVVTVSESGIASPEDCQKLDEKGFQAVLVGETLMRQPDPGAALKQLMSKVR